MDGKIQINPSAFQKDAKSIFRRPTRSTRLADRIDLEKMDCFVEVKQRILAGWAPSRITDYIENTHYDDFDKLGTSKGELTDAITAYRKKITPAELVSIRMPEVIEKAKAKVESGLNIMSEMENLYKIQKSRVDIDYNTEKKINKLFKNTGNEIAIAADLLRDIAQLRKDLGLTNPDDLTKMDDDVRQKLITDFGLKYGRQSVTNVLNDPKSVSKVLSVAESLFSSLKSDEVLALLKTAPLNVPQEEEQDEESERV